MSGGKGGMDLYVSKLNGGNWSAPVPLDFVNTENDDQYVSAAALGRYLIKESPGSRKNSELTEFLIPDELRPRGMMKVEGKITDDTGAPAAAYIAVLDRNTNKRVYSGRPATDGTYFVYLLEGTRYEMSIDPEQSNITYFSKQFDLTTDKTPQKEKVNAILKKPAAGDELSLDLVRFKPNSSSVESSSETELKRLARVAKANPDLKFEVQVLLDGYVEDSIQSNPDLTEMIQDSIHTQFDDIDTLGQLYQHDTVIARTTYHNNRTIRQSQAIIDYLVSQGASAANFRYFGNAIPATIPGNRKLTVKAVVRSK
jgi:hypothetical protein